LLHWLSLRFTDSIAVDTAGGTSRALLFVDPTADYLKDHFPGAPTLPGLVMLETAVQAAAALLEATRPGAEGATLTHLERLQIVRRVVPGETLTVVTTIDIETCGFTARGTVGGDTAMRARFRLDPVTGSRR
jgi:3-hydroxymyristoyl/3-hydroxydecanoyl-(acyl carrier protein) dehydratase